YKTSPGLIARINELENPDLIRKGQKLQVLQGPFRILINKGSKQLTVYKNETSLRTYSIATGKSDSTPEGSFKVRKKLIKPVWTDPYNRIVVSPDDPDYPLGSRWIEFAENGYGIHGTNNPDSIGKEA
ncbi:MAG: L,D-transpeptidase, partial [Candidatus Theseobacter exili]|nr:L,D-transpeptidase [Candidatus Theseobacter exili]